MAPRKKHISRENPLDSEVTNVVTGVVIAMVRLPTLPPWVYKESSIDDAMVVSFSGGTIVFDGFSMVLPHQDPHYPLSRKSFFLKAIGGNEG